MSSNQYGQRLPPPPGFTRHSDRPPILEPGLKDSGRPADFEGIVEQYDEFEIHLEKDPITPELIRKAQSAVFANSKINQLLTNNRHMPIGLSIVDEKSQNDEHQTISLLFVIYDYTDDKVLEVFLDQDGNTVNEIKESYYQPAPTNEEIEEAIKLAMNDTRIAGSRIEDMERNAILVTDINDSKNSRHRILDVRFYYSDERLARYMALVDLSSQIVVKAGPTCHDELSNKEVRG